MKQLNFEDYMSCVESYNKKYKNAVKAVNAEESLSAGYSLDSEPEWSCLLMILPVHIISSRNEWLTFIEVKCKPHINLVI